MENVRLLDFVLNNIHMKCRMMVNSNSTECKYKNLPYLYVFDTNKPSLFLSNLKVTPKYRNNCFYFSTIMLYVVITWICDNIVRHDNVN